jgi:hypothetical protein
MKIIIYSWLFCLKKWFFNTKNNNKWALRHNYYTILEWHCIVLSLKLD